MCIISNKLKAFTLIETMVALAVTSVVIGLASLIFLNFGSLQKKQSGEDSKYADLILFMNAFSYDIETCSKFTGNETEIIVEYDTIPQKTYYLFKDNEVIRNVKEKSDTFDFSIQEIELLRLQDDFQLIRVFSGNIVLKNLVFPVKIMKEYPRSLLFSINAKKNAH